MNSMPGRGVWGRGGGWGIYGRGRGGGRGWRNWYYATGMPGWQRAAYGYPAYGGGAYPYAPEPSAEEEKEALKEQAEVLKEQLADVQERMNTIEKAQKQEKIK